MTKDNKTASKAPTLDKLAEMLTDDKTRSDMKYIFRTKASAWGRA